jgi:lipoprotein-anchoring transpeptidase ErfK/SrfK
VAQYFRTRASRAIVTAVVLVIATVAIVKYQSVKSKKPQVSAKPTLMAAVPGNPGAADVGKPAAKTVVPPQPPADHPPAAPPIAPAPPAKNEAPPQNLPPSADLFDAAAAQVKAGDLVGARKLLNDSLVSGTLSGADADTAMKQIAELNKTLVFSDRRFKTDPHGGTYMVKPGDRLGAIADQYQVPVQILLQINNLKSGKDLKADMPIKVIQGPICAIVTKGKFKIDLYFNAPGGPNSTYLTSFPVGLGTDNSTPTGTWIITVRVANPSYNSPEGRASQHFAGGDPKNPIGPFWLGLAGTDGQAVGKQSYGIHGTIDPDSIGKQASMGCIRLKNEDVEKVYDLMVAKKSVVVVRD